MPMLFVTELLGTWFSVSELYWHLPSLVIVACPALALLVWCATTDATMSEIRDSVSQECQVRHGLVV
jgi:hypothetical protein